MLVHETTMVLAPGRFANWADELFVMLNLFYENQVDMSAKKM